MAGERARSDPVAREREQDQAPDTEAGGDAGGQRPQRHDGAADDVAVVTAADGLVGGHDLSLISALGSRFLFSDSSLSHIA